jgi:hypothetical protein
MKEFLVVLILLCFTVGACQTKTSFSKTVQVQDSSFRGSVTIKKLEKLDRYRLSIKNTVSGETDRIFIPFEVFAMQTGDINGDGRTDICLGVIKPTPFDPVMKKRLFIFQIDRDYIRPLWLSSRLVSPLEAFAVQKDNAGAATVKTIEKNTASAYCVREYKWASFGMTMVAQDTKVASYSSALTLLNTNSK